MGIDEYPRACAPCPNISRNSPPSMSFPFVFSALAAMDRTSFRADILTDSRRESRDQVEKLQR